jgi:hypothetical protein
MTQEQRACANDTGLPQEGAVISVNKEKGVLIIDGEEVEAAHICVALSELGYTVKPTPCADFSPEERAAALASLERLIGEAEAAKVAEGGVK